MEFHQFIQSFIPSHTCTPSNNAVRSTQQMLTEQPIQFNQTHNSFYRVYILRTSYMSTYDLLVSTSAAFTKFNITHVSTKNIYITQTEYNILCIYIQSKYYYYIINIHICIIIYHMYVFSLFLSLDFFTLN